MAQNLQQYKVLSRIATGATGAVHRGRNSKTKTDVAIKLFNSEIAGNPTLRKRFVQSAEHLHSLKHEHIAQILDALADGENLFVVMDFAPGKPLSSMLGTRARPLSPELAIPLISQALKSLIHAHAHGMSHGALKPTDVIIAPDGKVKVEGFGIVEILGPAIASRAASRAGALPYVAPERLKSTTKPDAQADVYSAGMMLYQMLTGALPYVSTISEAQVRSAIAKGVLPASPVFDNLPPSLVAIVRRALAKNREERPSAREFLRALQNVPLKRTAASIMQATPPSALPAASELPPKRVSIQPVVPLTGVAIRNNPDAATPSDASSKAASKLASEQVQPSSPSQSSSSQSSAAAIVGAAGVAGTAAALSASGKAADSTATDALREILKNAAPENVPPQASQSALVQQRLNELRASQGLSKQGSSSDASQFGEDDSAALGLGATGAALAGGAGGNAFADDRAGAASQTPFASADAPSDRGADSRADSPKEEKQEKRKSGVGAMLTGAAVAGVLIGGTYFYFTTNKKPAPSTETKGAERAALPDSLANNIPEVHADWRDTVEPGTPLWDSLEALEKAAREAATRPPETKTETPPDQLATNPDTNNGGGKPATKQPTTANKGDNTVAVNQSGDAKGKLPSILANQPKSSSKKQADGDDSPLAAIKKASSDAMKATSKNADGANTAIQSSKTAQTPKTSGAPAQSEAQPNSYNSTQKQAQQKTSAANPATTNPATTNPATSKTSAAKETRQERAARLRAEQQVKREARKAAAQEAAQQRRTGAQQRSATAPSRRTSSGDTPGLSSSKKAKKHSRNSSRIALSKSASLKSASRTASPRALSDEQTLQSGSSSAQSPRSSWRKSSNTALYRGRKSRAAQAKETPVPLAERSSDALPNSMNANSMDRSDLMMLRGHLGAVQSVSFSPDGKLLASGGVDKTVKVWDVATGKILRSMRGHAKGVTTVFFSPDGKHLMSGSKDQTVKVWNVETGERMQSTAGITCTGSPMAFSPDGTLLATSRNKVITIAKVQPRSNKASTSSSEPKK